ncbi:hypothetical protein COO60DRAFT_1547655 [Scenedesmus sp. NREL 46B-D3]|nr:hypothetical protein COO60DRAFT_1547655 [Scenedesmus sp. NREL 46B-D3]
MRSPDFSRPEATAATTINIVAGLLLECILTMQCAVCRGRYCSLLPKAAFRPDELADELLLPRWLPPPAAMANFRRQGNTPPPESCCQVGKVYLLLPVAGHCCTLCLHTGAAPLTHQSPRPVGDPDHPKNAPVIRVTPALLSCRCPGAAGERGRSARLPSPRSGTSSAADLETYASVFLVAADPVSQSAC